jgi:hypothetical protein
MEHEARPRRSAVIRHRPRRSAVTFLSAAVPHSPNRSTRRRAACGWMRVGGCGWVDAARGARRAPVVGPPPPSPAPLPSPFALSPPCTPHLPTLHPPHPPKAYAPSTCCATWWVGLRAAQRAAVGRRTAAAGPPHRPPHLPCPMAALPALPCPSLSMPFSFHALPPPSPVLLRDALGAHGLDAARLSLVCVPGLGWKWGDTHVQRTHAYGTASRSSL